MNNNGNTSENNSRLNYSSIKEKNTLIIAAAFTVVLAFILLWFLGEIDLIHFTLLIFIAPFFVGYYTFKKRYCPTCRKKMIKQIHGSTLYYFCDHCKLKLKIEIDVLED